MIVMLGIIVLCGSFGYAAEGKTAADKKAAAQKKAVVDKTKKSAASTGVKEDKKDTASKAAAKTVADEAAQETAKAHPVVPSKATGTVTGCDLKNSRITVQVNSKVNFVFNIDKTTELTAKGKQIKLADINKGEKVMVGFKPGKEDQTAIFVAVQTPPVMSVKPPVKKTK